MSVPKNGNAYEALAKTQLNKALNQKQAKGANCGDSGATVYRRCTFYQNKASEETKTENK